MVFSEADLQTAAHDLKEGRAQVDALTASIMDARRAGQPTHRLETALITMLINLEHLRRREENSRVSLASAQPR
jgi:hypothetical protein